MKQKQRYIELPDCWEELTQADWRELLKIRQKVVEHGGKYSELDITTETARMLLQHRGVELQIKNPNYIQLVAQLAKSLGWLWHAEGNTISLVYKDTRNLIPKVREWLGPMDHGADLMFGEFRMAMAIMKNYEQHPSERDLNVLAGLLYRPEASEQMQHEQQLRRQPYDWDNFEQKEMRGQQMQRWQVWGIYAWFAWFREYLTTGTFIIEGEEVCFSRIFGNRDNNGTDGEEKSSGGMAQICHSLAETHVFGTAKEVDHTLLLTVMQKLLQDYDSVQRLKKEMRRK